MVIATCAVIGFGYVTSALTATNVVPATNAGDGSATISGFAVTNIDYALDAARPFWIDAVTFTIAPVAASSVRIELNGTVYACNNAAGSVSCDTTSPQAEVVDPPTLQVIAAS